MHSLTFDFYMKVALSFDKNTAEPGENVSLSITSDPQSLVNLLAVDQSVLLLASGNDITQSDVNINNINFRIIMILHTYTSLSRNRFNYKYQIVISSHDFLCHHLLSSFS